MASAPKDTVDTEVNGVEIGESRMEIKLWVKKALMEF